MAIRVRNLMALPATSGLAMKRLSNWFLASSVYSLAARTAVILPSVSKWRLRGPRMPSLMPPPIFAAGPRVIGNGRHARRADELRFAGRLNDKRRSERLHAVAVGRAIVDVAVGFPHGLAGRLV